MSRILVAESIAQAGLDKMSAAGHQVDIQLGLSPDQLVEAVVGASALVVRSASTVTPEVLEAGTDLVVVGRAGVGLDNVDVDEATKRGVLVANAPQSNVISAAEQTMALILAQARNTAQANSALREGRWERSKWTGMELHGKTLGIIGLGRIGGLVAERAKAFGLRLIGFDPYVSEERARQMSVELESIEQLAARSDIVTVHVARTPETIGLIGAKFLDGAKDGIRIINVARGGIVNEADLLAGLESGKVGGAGLDVYDSEPCTDSPLFAHPNVVATPHLGASTVEAQDKAGVTIAEQVNLALAGDFVPFAVNIDAAALPGVVEPYMPLAEKLGGLLGSLGPEAIGSKITVDYEGEIGGYDNRLLTLAAAKGVASQLVDEPVSFVNAIPLLREQGIEVEVTATTTPRDYVNRLAIRSEKRCLAGSLIGMQNEARLVQIDDQTIEVAPSDHMLFIRNDDSPGVIGGVGTALGAAGINVGNMGVGRSEKAGLAAMVIGIGQSVPEAVLAELRQTAGVLSVDVLSLNSQHRF